MNHLLGKEILARDDPDLHTPPPQPESDEESEILDEPSYINYIKNATVTDMEPFIDSPVVEAIHKFKHRDALYQAFEADPSSLPKFYKDIEILHTDIHKDGKIISVIYIPDIPTLEKQDEFGIQISDSLREAMIRQFHKGLMGHAGYKKVYQKMQSKFFWLGMYRDIKKFCEEYTSC